MLLNTQSFATGGWGPDEAWRTEPVVTHSPSIPMPASETPCGAYGHAKDTHYLLRVTKTLATVTAWSSL
jgi:hypothetical protein